MTTRGPEDNTALVNYTDTHLWANPEENLQYQVKLVRVTFDFGANLSFNYMNRWRSLPKPNKFFHVFSIGGLDPGYWNFDTNVLRRNPLDRWVNLGQLSRQRGLQLDVYNARGFQFSRSHAWLMTTIDGVSFIAVEKFPVMPIKVEDDLWFRCYTTSTVVDVNEVAVEGLGNPYIYESMFYELPDEVATLTTAFNKAKAKPGFTCTFHNGVFFNDAPNKLTGLQFGDVVEIWHDPTVIRTETYKFNTLKDFYSVLDQKRKVILHPTKRKGDFTLRYFDDNDYFVIGTQKRGLYLSRNDPATIRQLTHVDVAIAADVLQNMANYLPDLSNPNNVSVMVLVRKTDWEYPWPHEHHRIRYLYRLSDTGIVQAFTGDRATVPEWSAAGLENGPTMALLREQYNAIKRAKAMLGLGYNAATRALSETPLRTVFEAGGKGVEVPPTYRTRFTAWEHNEAGHLLSFRNVSNTQFYAPVNPLCTKVEFTFGLSGRTLDSITTNQSVTLDRLYSYRVYITPFNVTTGKITGDFTDVTGDASVYEIKDGVLTWKQLDTVNQRGYILSNKNSLAYTFEMEHIDHSLSFALTQIYANGGLLTPMALAQVDIYLNGHPLIDKVDWLFDGMYCYIHNKEFLVDGPQTITVRAHGFHPDQAEPNSDTELGFVDGGVIGRFNRYNLRGDRVTRTVINGGLYLTDEVPRAEREVPDDQLSTLNGRPYMVKHVYCPVVGIDHDNFSGFQSSRDVDKRVSDYLTRWLPKPRNNAEEIHWELNDPNRPNGSGVPVVSNLQDKYRLFSQFMNVVVNGLKQNLITLPTMLPGETVYSNQAIENVVKQYKWWLKLDPAILDYDRRYFAIQPFANIGLLSVTSKQFLFIKQVNDLYLNSVCEIEGHFEVTV